MLQLRELHPDDEGKYTCIVSNQYGSFRHTISVDSIGKDIQLILIYLTVRLRFTLIKETRSSAMSLQKNVIKVDGNIVNIAR